MLDEMSIPKRLFFIWLGDNQPNHVQFCIDSFKKMNPQYEIVFIRKTMKQLNDILIEIKLTDKYDSDILNCFRWIVQKDGKYSDYIRHQKTIYNSNIRFIQILGDILRVELINKYGGIYLDCDTYPMKPFDDLLNRENFIVTRHYTSGNVWFDNYFMGSNTKTEITDPINGYDLKNGILQTYNGWQKSISYIKNRYNFMKCNEKDMVINDKFFIEHYYKSDWKNVNTQMNMIYSKLDELVR